MFRNEKFQDFHIRILYFPNVFAKEHVTFFGFLKRIIGCLVINFEKVHFTDQFAKEQLVVEKNAKDTDKVYYSGKHTSKVW